MKEGDQDPPNVSGECRGRFRRACRSSEGGGQDRCCASLPFLNLNYLNNLSFFKPYSLSCTLPLNFIVTTHPSSFITLSLLFHFFHPHLISYSSLSLFLSYSISLFLILFFHSHNTINVSHFIYATMYG